MCKNGDDSGLGIGKMLILSKSWGSEVSRLGISYQDISKMLLIDGV